MKCNIGERLGLNLLLLIRGLIDICVKYNFKIDICYMYSFNDLILIYCNQRLVRISSLTLILRTNEDWVKRKG